MPNFDREKLQTFGQAVQDLWLLALASAPDEFQARAIEVVRKVVPFDACFWAIASTGSSELVPHAIHLDGISPEAIVEYQAIREVDVVARWVLENPGRTLHFDVRAEAGRAPPEVIDYDVRHGIGQILCTMVVEPVPQLSSFLSLYRPPGGPTFTEEERSLVEALAPHLASTFEACRARGAGGADRSAPVGAVACIDTVGTLHSRDDELERLLRQEWPGWQGRDLPDPVRGLCRTGGSWTGEVVVVRVDPPRGAFTTVAVRRKVPADRLSPRELEIARAFALGAEAAEIAANTGLSVASVRNRIRDVHAKLGTSSRSAIAEALAPVRPR